VLLRQGFRADGNRTTDRTRGKHVRYVAHGGAIPSAQLVRNIGETMPIKVVTLGDQVTAETGGTKPLDPIGNAFEVPEG